MDYLIFSQKRENRIVSLLGFFRCLTASQLAKLEFPFPSGYRKSQIVLKRMFEKKLINRFRHYREWVYHLGDKSKNWQHHLQISGFHISLLSHLKSWHKVIGIEKEYLYSYGQADALYSIRNIITDKDIKFYLEMDLDSGNPFDKVQNYENLYWSSHDNDWFVVVVTVRPDKVKQIVSKGKVIKWKVLGLSDDISEVLR